MTGSTLDAQTVRPHRDDGPIRSFRHDDFTLADLLAHKGSTTVSVCLPARNEAATVASIVTTLHDELLVPGVIDEIVVIDDHSTDSTASVAASAGARVVDAAAILPEFGGGHGKGEVLWKSLFVTDGDLVVWCDADISEFGSRFVSGLLGPLLCEPDVDFAKGFYQRPDNDSRGGGRVTELVARPMLSLYFPGLAELRQPLSGEYAGRRSVLETLPFFQGYGVDIGLLIDLSATIGTGRLAQVDLEVRHHRNRSLEELGPQAASILQTVLHRVDPTLAPEVSQLLRADLPPLTVDVSQRPPMVQVPGYANRSSTV